MTCNDDESVGYEKYFNVNCDELSSRVHIDLDHYVLLTFARKRGKP